jgi:hypothetical protein
VLSYLIRKKGIADRLFHVPFDPVERSSLLPRFEAITIEGKGPNWGELPPFSLRGLTTVPLVLLAGPVSEAIKYDTYDVGFPRRSKEVKLALHFSHCYVEEMYGENIPYRRKAKAAGKLVEIHREWVRETLCSYWSSVETLARALMEHKTLPESRVFEIIERGMLEDGSESG